jgi:hypothetical protein
LLLGARLSLCRVWEELEGVGVKVGGDEGVGSGGTRTKHRRRKSVLLVGRILVDGAMIYASWKY